MKGIPGLLGPYRSVLTRCYLCPRGRTASSASSPHSWFLRQSRDRFVKGRIQENYHSRAAFKLVEIQRKHRVIERGDVVLDLGAAPGGWSQVALKACGGSGKVISVDLLPILSLPGTGVRSFAIQGDMTSKVVHEQIREFTQGVGVDVIISDMAHSFSGNRIADVARVHDLCLLTLEVACRPGMLISPDGRLVCKVLQGAGTPELKSHFEQHFAHVVYCKPEASRKDSTEVYLICKGFQGRTMD